MFEIIIDTREQNAFTFTSISPRPKIKYQGLSTGDYSVIGYEDQITIERKSLPDLFGSFGKGRKRLRSEFERMAEYDYAAIVIEQSLSDIFQNPPPSSQMNPKAVFRSLLSWSMKYHVYCWPAPDRVFAERMTYLLLKSYYLQQAGEKTK